MDILLNKAHYPVHVLGPGRRIGLWLQGCSIACPGCISQDTWEADPGRRMPLQQLLAWCAERIAACDGVTISGGEPFEQPQALAALLAALDAWRGPHGHDFDILCYSGHSLRRLRRRHSDLLARIDALISGPYRAAAGPGGCWRGSANQLLTPLTGRGRRRYAGCEAASASDGDKRMQMSVADGRVWLIGIPRHNDMQALQALCRQRGLTLADVSWR